ncbi:hypothetical protein JCM21714_3289 [Gracilibacillus boraciitolerans JCM 21714]|uniref:Uncharacterized protein n=1 Tax=Gracilibacillus boraciitolerans JCM 21714 TaxID=1298598 RepID=W4VN26_9BACI|nr:hypothetical protein JCM21714_3289 [Gracilibacillus boraciitolerans JCM 21714]
MRSIPIISSTGPDTNAVIAKPIDAHRRIFPYSPLLFTPRLLIAMLSSNGPEGDMTKWNNTKELKTTTNEVLKKILTLTEMTAKYSRINKPFIVLYLSLIYPKKGCAMILTIGAIPRIVPISMEEKPRKLKNKGKKGSISPLLLALKKVNAFKNLICREFAIEVHPFLIFHYINVS